MRGVFPSYFFRRSFSLRFHKSDFRNVACKNRARQKCEEFRFSAPRMNSFGGEECCDCILINIPVINGNPL